MPFQIGNRFPPATISDSRINSIRNSDIPPEMKVWENIKEFFCQTNKADALECIRKIFHPPVITTREDVAGRFEQLRSLAYPAYEENIQSALNEENHFRILGENSREILLLTLNDLGEYIVESEGYSAIHPLTTSSQRAEDYEAVWSDWIRTSPPNEVKDRNEIVEQMRGLLKDNSTSLGIFSSNVSSLPPIPEGVKSLDLRYMNNLRTIPVLPDNLKTLVIDSCKNLDISNMPTALETLEIESAKKISSLPDRVRNLSITECNVPALPEGLIKLNLRFCDGGVITSNSLTNLKELKIDSCDNVKIQEFPSSLEKIELSGDKLNIPDLPDGLLTLSLNYLFSNDFTFNGMPVLPGSLRKLDILVGHGIENVVIPLKLPETLSDITIRFNDVKKWNISPMDLPRNINIKTYNVLLNPECYNRQDVTFNEVYAESAVKFELGDVLYGLAYSRHPVLNIIENINAFNEKDIIIQNTLTDAVWNRRYYIKFNSDDQIKESLNDSDRGIQFKKFLENHKRYNVTDRNSEALTDKASWIKTSKAGLEFQTKVRESKVIFCVDNLVNSIDHIASKSGEHGKAITAHELRWLYRNRDDDKIKENVLFSLKGKLVSHEEVFSLKGWELYQPKKGPLFNGLMTEPQRVFGRLNS